MNLKASATPTEKAQNRRAYLTDEAMPWARRAFRPTVFPNFARGIRARLEQIKH